MSQNGKTPSLRLVPNPKQVKDAKAIRDDAVDFMGKATTKSFALGGVMTAIGAITNAARMGQANIALHPDDDLAASVKDAFGEIYQTAMGLSELIRDKADT